eukprot:gene10999-14773_t
MYRSFVDSLDKPLTSGGIASSGFLLFAALRKTSFYRTIRSYGFIPISVVGVAYASARIFPSNNNNITQTNLLSFILSYAKDYIGGNTTIGNIVGDILGVMLVIKVLDTIDYTTSLRPSEVMKAIIDRVFNTVKTIPFLPVKEMMQKEKSKMEGELEKDLKAVSRKIGTNNYSLPVKGSSPETVIQLMQQASGKDDSIWENGKVSGVVYHGQRDHQVALNNAFNLYSLSNPLHPDIWPSVMKYDSEIIAMTASLVNGGLDTVCGSTSSGGTESIILAIKTHREYYREHYGITNPEMICAVSAHAAVDKGCELMNIKLIKVPVDPATYRIDLNALVRAIGPNTILMYASAPSYPQGAIDPVAEMGKIATYYNIGLHVDCCLGGFVLPFAKKLGYDVPAFDFSVPGVTSMSLDTHKYGYALKGTSVVLYRTPELRHAQYFCYSQWTGGMYVTPSIAGSRSGGLIAQCWASLVILGEEGYLKHTQQIFETVAKIRNGIRDMKELKLLGNAEAMIICFASDDSTLNVYDVAEKMAKKGWNLNSLQNPACVHICCTVKHYKMDQLFLDDLRNVINDIKSDPNRKSEGKAAIYGLVSSLPPGPVSELLKVYTDVIQKV